MVLVCIGIAIATFNDLELRLYGLVVALIFVPVAAVYKVQFKRVLKDYDMLSLLHRVYPPAIFVMCLLSLLLDARQHTNLPLQKLHKFLQLILVCGISISSFHIVDVFSPLTHRYWDCQVSLTIRWVAVL